jgi:hypothetical protein
MSSQATIGSCSWRACAARAAAIASPIFLEPAVSVAGKVTFSTL